MDIHKPKAAHSWREFLVEIGTITCGILIALGLEQAVEATHHVQEADEAREVIEAEVKTDLTRLALRDHAHDCVARRLDELEGLVDTTPDDGRLQAPTWVGRPPRFAIETARWDAASQSGRISLLPAEWQSRFSLIYAGLRYHLDLNNAEELTWSRLNGVIGLDRLSSDGKLTVKSELEQARFYNGSLHQVTSVLLRSAAKAGVRPEDRRDTPYSICWPVTTPTADGRARMFSGGELGRVAGPHPATQQPASPDRLLWSE